MSDAGNKFNLEVLAIACDQTIARVTDDLDKALRGEYVIRLDDMVFKFVHDRVQQAALSLVYTILSYLVSFEF